MSRSFGKVQAPGQCPAAVGCRRVSVGNAHVSCRWKGRFRWSRACRRWSVNPSRKLRRFESFTCHHVRERASDLRKRKVRGLLTYTVGVSKTALLWRSSGSGPQASDLVNARTDLGGIEVCGECARKLGFTPPCWPDCRRADLRVCRGWGYAIAVETNTIALDNSGVTTVGIRRQRRRWAVPVATHGG